MGTLDTSQPFTAAQAATSGITPAQLRGRAFRSLHRGVFVRADIDVDLDLRARAALLLFPGSARVSHTTAARLLGIPVPDDAQVHVAVTAQADRRRRPGIRCHVRPSGRRWERRGLALSAPEDVFCELGNLLTLPELLAAADTLVARYRLQPRELVLLARQHRGRGVGVVRQAAELAAQGVGSSMESRVRLLLILAGFPEPAINKVVPRGDSHFRPDLCWPELLLAIEYDGQHHRSDLDQWDGDIQRREWFQSQGWTVVTVVARDIFKRPETLLARIYRAWLECGGPSFTLRDDWRSHFQGR